MNIIGLGQCGCSIAKCFEKYPQYSIHYINTEKIESKEYLFPEQEYYVSDKKVNIGKTFLLKEQKSHEAYEANCPDFSKFLKKVKDKTFFIIGGSGTISGAALRILEHLKHAEITLIYIKPEIALLSEIGSLQERAVYNVLQEYTRSGVFENMYIFDNPILEELVPDITVYNQYDKLNELISFSLHMINVFDNTRPVTSTMSGFSEISRIGTLGSFDIDKNLETFYFSLDNVSEKCYYYAIPEKQLKEDTDLFRKIKEQMKQKTEKGKNRISYMIHPTEHSQPHCYILAKSSQIQK